MRWARRLLCRGRFPGRLIYARGARPPLPLPPDHLVAPVRIDEALHREIGTPDQGPPPLPEDAAPGAGALVGRQRAGAVPPLVLAVVVEVLARQAAEERI